MLTQEQLTMMAENVARIRENMAAAAREAGRDPADILLCAACKTRTVEEVIASTVLPIDLFGENHVQELVEKTDANAYCGKPGHFIGHLQTNKVNKVVGRAALIESVDSEHLLQKVERAAAAANLTQEILIEINIGGEESKSGVSAESLWPLLDMAAAQPHIRLRGLMAIPPALQPRMRPARSLPKCGNCWQKLLTAIMRTPKWISFPWHERGLPRCHPRGCHHCAHRHRHLRRTRLQQKGIRHSRNPYLHVDSCKVNR